MATVETKLRVGKLVSLEASCMSLSGPSRNPTLYKGWSTKKARHLIPSPYAHEALNNNGSPA